MRTQGGSQRSVTGSRPLITPATAARIRRGVTSQRRVDHGAPLKSASWSRRPRRDSGVGHGGHGAGHGGAGHDPGTRRLRRTCHSWRVRVTATTAQLRRRSRRSQRRSRGSRRRLWRTRRGHGGPLWGRLRGDGCGYRTAGPVRVKRPRGRLDAWPVPATTAVSAAGRAPFIRVERAGQKERCNDGPTMHLEFCSRWNAGAFYTDELFLKRFRLFLLHFF